MVVSWAPQRLWTVLARAKSALKDEANRLKFAEFIEAQRKSLTAFDAEGAQEIARELRFVIFMVYVVSASDCATRHQEASARYRVIM